VALKWKRLDICLKYNVLTSLVWNSDEIELNRIRPMVVFWRCKDVSENVCEKLILDTYEFWQSPASSTYSLVDQWFVQYLMYSSTNIRCSTYKCTSQPCKVHSLTPVLTNELLEHVERTIHWLHTRISGGTYSLPPGICYVMSVFLSSKSKVN
jgi:hypothetical protein